VKQGELPREEHSTGEKGGKTSSVTHREGGGGKAHIMIKKKRISPTRNEGEIVPIPTKGGGEGEVGCCKKKEKNKTSL